jgi:hypothetical protein
VEIALQGATSSVPYDVRLESKSGEGPLWSAKLLPIISAAGDGHLVFDVPSGIFKSDIYSFAVTSSAASGSVRHYDFETRVQK